MTYLENERGSHRTKKNHGNSTNNIIYEFLLDEVINPKGEFYSNQSISLAQVDVNKRGGGDDDDD